MRKNFAHKSAVLALMISMFVVTVAQARQQQPQQYPVDRTEVWPTTSRTATPVALSQDSPPPNPHPRWQIVRSDQWVDQDGDMILLAKNPFRIIGAWVSRCQPYGYFRVDPRIERGPGYFQRSEYYFKDPAINPAGETKKVTVTHQVNDYADSTCSGNVVDNLVDDQGTWSTQGKGDDKVGAIYFFAYTRIRDVNPNSCNPKREICKTNLVTIRLDSENGQPKILFGDPEARVEVNGIIRGGVSYLLSEGFYWSEGLAQ